MYVFSNPCLVDLLLEANNKTFPKEYMHIALVSSPKKSINFVRGHEIDKTAFVVDIQGGRIHPFCFVFFYSKP